MQQLRSQSLTYKDPLQSEINMHSGHNCRICHQKFVNENVQEFCNCAGQQNRVHQKCLMQEIKQGKIYQQANISYCFCKTCQGRILLKTQRKIKIKSLSQVSKQLFCFPELGTQIKRIILFLVMTALCAIQGYFIYILIKDSGKKQSKIIIALTSINSLLIVISLIYFIFSFVIQRTKQIVGIRGLTLTNIPSCTIKSVKQLQFSAPQTL